MGKQAAAIGARIRKHIADAVKLLVFEIARELRRATPVDTGHARRNWLASIGSPSTTETNDEAAYEASLVQVVSYQIGQGPVWLTNVVGYVRLLNYGSSDQEPAGWIERAIDIGFQKAQAKLAKAGKTDLDVSGLRAEFQGGIGSEGAGNLASAYSPFGDD